MTNIKVVNHVLKIFDSITIMNERCLMPSNLRITFLRFLLQRFLLISTDQGIREIKFMYVFSSFTFTKIDKPTRDNTSPEKRIFSFEYEEKF